MTQPATSAAGGSRFLPVVERYGLLSIWVVLIAVFGAIRPGTFLQWDTVSLVLGSQSVLVILALALMVPLAAGDFDLSVAAVMTFSAMLFALATVVHGIGLAAAIVLVLLVGLVIGLINALFIVYFGINSLIITLGTGTFISGLVLWVSGSQTISGISPALIQFLIIDRILGIPVAFYCGLLLCLLLAYAFSRTLLGLRILFVGRNRGVARLSGIPVAKLRVGCLIASAIGASLAGIVYAGTNGAADPSSGLSFLLPAFAAVFLGSTTLVPGRFNAFGTFVSVYFLMTGITGLTMLGVETFVQNLFYGGALVLAVTLSQLAGGKAAE